MKITLLNTAYPYRGGIAVFTERLARAFQDAGDKVNISTFSLQYPSILFPGKSQYSTSEKPKDLEIISEVNSVNPINWLRIGFKIKKQKPDILILKYWIPFMSPCLGTISRIVKSNKHTKVIVVVDNLIPHEKRMGDNLLNSYFVASVDGFITMSKSVFDDLDQFDENKKKVLGVHPLYDNFGVSKTKEEALDSLKLDKSFNYMLFFGIIRKYKGLDILLEAINKVSNLDIKLLIAGECYSQKNRYKKMIDCYNLNDKIIWHNYYIPDNDIKYYFSACDAVVLPHKKISQSGIIPIAYEFNKLVICSNISSFKENIIDNKTGYLFENNNSNSLSIKIEYIYSNHNFINSVKFIKKFKKRYSNQNIINDFKKLISL